MNYQETPGVKVPEHQGLTKPNVGLLASRTSTLDPNKFSIVFLLTLLQKTPGPKANRISNKPLVLSESQTPGVDEVQLKYLEGDSQDQLEASIFRALFTGDIDNDLSDDISRELIVGGGQLIEYIKIPHHGSKNGITEKLLDTIKPAVAVISVGKGNSYGHPHEEVLRILSERDIKIFRTDQIGDIVFEYP
jgi:hypothetical protein